jgi:hypothetical protein
MKPVAIPDDELVPDEQLAAEWQVNRRTLTRYESAGLPVVMLGGRKYRPLAACRAWLSSRIKRPNPPRQRLR